MWLYNFRLHTTDDQNQIYNNNNIIITARVAGSAAEGAVARKSAKYTDIETNYMFQPIAVESLGPINAPGCAFLSKLGRKLST